MTTQVTQPTRSQEEIKYAWDMIWNNYTRGTYNREQTFNSLADFYKWLGATPQQAVDWAESVLREREGKPPLPPITTPPPVSPPVTTAPGVVATPQPQPEAAAAFQQMGEEAPFAAFLKQYGLPGYGQSAAQRWQTNLYDPAYATYQAASALNPATATPDWTAFLGGLGPAGLMGTRPQAAGLFKQALGQEPIGQRAFQEALGGDFNDFMANVLRGRYAAPVARRMAQWIPGMEQQFLGESMGAPDTSFLRFLQQRMNL